MAAVTVTQKLAHKWKMQDGKDGSKETLKRVIRLANIEADESLWSIRHK